MEPSWSEKRKQLIGRLACYVLSATGSEPDAATKRQAEDIYGYGPWEEDSLCTVVRALSEEERERITYGNVRSREARLMCDWWEEHQEKDAARERRKREEQEKRGLAAAALAKLTQEEREALGL